MIPTGLVFVPVMASGVALGTVALGFAIIPTIKAKVIEWVAPSQEQRDTNSPEPVVKKEDGGWNPVVAFGSLLARVQTWEWVKPKPRPDKDE